MKSTNRISLAEASLRAPKILERGDSQLLEEGAPPTLADLAGALQFALGDGRIWLNDERMVMLQANVLGSLRKDIIDMVGLDRARKLFLTTGWLQGVYYANLVANRFNQDNLTAALAAGPRLHTMEGFVKVTTKRFEFDVARKYYHGEFYWHDSTEGMEHVHNLGISECPVCWMQVGVPAGYTSTILGFPVIFREIECVGQGAQRCVVIGKNAEAWGEDLPEMVAFGLRPKSGQKSKPWKPPADFPIRAKPVDSSEIVGRSTALARARRLIEKVASYAEPVLFLGESGTGKEHFARRLHELGTTPNGPFIPVNCSIFDAGIEAGNNALFGPEGLVEQAKGGTLFLDDVIALPPALQSRMAMLMQKMKTREKQFRVVSATREQPLEALAKGRLRADLYYHLSLLPVVIPPLRERRDDLPALIKFFLNRHAAHHDKPPCELSGPALDLLLRYDYPGNVRELSNMIERGVIYAEPGAKIEISQIFTGVEKTPQFMGQLGLSGGIYSPKTINQVREDRTLEEMETEAYISALEECGWNISAAARKLGLTRAKLHYRITKLNLRRTE